MGEDIRICLLGWGAINRQVARLLAARGSAVRIVAVAVRDAGMAREDLPLGAALIEDPAQLAELCPDLVVEGAGRASVIPWGTAALTAGADFAVSSTAAFVEPGALEGLVALARIEGRQVVIAPGALGGVDALAAAGRLELEEVRHRVVKPARAWRGTEAERLCDLDGLSAAVTFFEGTAREAADRFPQNANVAVISALSGIGLERTRIELVADPTAEMNRHEITAQGAFGRLSLRLENRPLADNPKSSAMTALNLVRMIENQRGALVL